MDANLKREVIGGLTTFFTMSYIVVVNPAILASEGTGMNFNAVLTATVMLCFTMTLLMGLYAKLPFAIAPGMGINAFFTYTIILGHQIPWPIALGMVFWSGVLFLLISATPLRENIVRSIPPSLKAATGVGIGLFLSFIGLKNMGLIQDHPVTLVSFAKITPTIVLSLLGFTVICLLLRRKNPLAFLSGIFLTSFLAWSLGLLSTPDQWLSAPNFESHLFKLDIWGSLQWTLLPTIISLMLTDLYDSLSTFVGVSRATGLVDEHGEPKNLRQGLVVDALATLSAGLFGSSSGTAYIESASGVEAGGRSGTTAVITAFCFLPCLFIAPLAALVPSYAVGPVLLMVGFLLFRTIQEIPIHPLEEALPAFLTIILIPLTFSITQGILWGFISHVGLFCLAGRGRELPTTLLAMAGLSVLLLSLEYFH